MWVSVFVDVQHPRPAAICFLPDACCTFSPLGCFSQARRVSINKKNLIEIQNASAVLQRFSGVAAVKEKVA